MPKPHTHLIEVEVRIKHSAATEPLAKDEVLVMPVWTPGSYLIREFERHVQDFAAFDAAGKPLVWEKINKNSWRVMMGSAREWRANYRVYANELSVRTSEVNSEHAFFEQRDGLDVSRRLLRAPGDAARAVAPQPWKVATGLPPVPGEKNTFRAENFDVPLRLAGRG